MKTYFLIDDDVDDQEFFVMALADIDKTIKCVIADSGIDALKKLNTDTGFIPDLIFMDMNMPRMSGRECIAEIKKIERLKDTPVIFYSTFDSQTGNKEASLAGADSFFTKPVSVAALTTLLENIIKTYATD